MCVCMCVRQCKHACKCIIFKKLFCVVRFRIVLGGLVNVIFQVIVTLDIAFKIKFDNIV